MYSFMPSESFYARSFGLTVNIYYKDLVSLHMYSISKNMLLRNDSPGMC